MSEDMIKERDFLERIKSEISRVVVGKNDIKELLLLVLLSKGHLLIEGRQGTAKTTLARTFAQAIGGSFKRVQGTPDMMPADILGFYLHGIDASSRFMPGPIFANVLLVDEMNRITPRTQAALLEAMQERQVTIERETHRIDEPFLLIASQMPYGSAGTSPLNDIQVDRFTFRGWSDYPSSQEEELVLSEIDRIVEATINPVVTPADIHCLQRAVREVHVTAGIREYIVALVNKLRGHPDLSSGPSPRGSIALLMGGRAKAFIEGRDYVIPDDIKGLLVPALYHRCYISPEAEMENVSVEAVIGQIAGEVPVPKT
ncbi:MAG: MoxR family ATPase [Dehalococcoidales bacterium]|jgi:MoxR-like ATPase